MSVCVSEMGHTDNGAESESIARDVSIVLGPLRRAVMYTSVSLGRRARVCALAGAGDERIDG